MNRKPQQGFNIELCRVIKEYHEWHGDRSVQIVSFVCSPEGLPMILTRVTGEDGKKSSCLLEFDICYQDNGNGELMQTWNIIERESADRKDEYYMLCRYMTGCYGNDDSEEDEDG